MLLNRFVKTAWTVGVVTWLLIGAAGSAHAADVTLNASDLLSVGGMTVNETSLDTSLANGNHWNNGAVPSAGNDYFTGDFILRTPANNSSLTFAGDSLTVNNTNGFNDGGIFYKGSGTTGVITIDNLILDGGSITHQSSSNDVFQLAGSINVVGDSRLFARQGGIEVSAPISGSATITNPGGSCTNCVLTFSSPNNTFTGNLVNQGRFMLADNAVMNFVIGPSGVNNSVSGPGAQTQFNGDFILDLSGASTTLGDSWNLVTATNTSYGASFAIPGFTESGNVWKSGIYQFSEATGILSVAPTAGDVNSDGDVNDEDYDIILAHFQMAGAARDDGDLNGDGVVNLSDFAEWRLAKETLLAVEVGVPEPLAAVQLLLGVCGWHSFARRLRTGAR